MTISNISSGNKALQFIDDRIKSDEYRGVHVSQHNRYDMDVIVGILTLFDRYSPSQELMRIRTTDISKRPQNYPEEAIYARFCDDAKKKYGIGSQDAMRKNLFVDMHRMGLIKRYNKDRNLIDPFSRGRVQYVSISDQGLKLIDSEKTILEQRFIFSKAINKLLGGQIEILLNILRDSEHDIGSIFINEYMFFISAINMKTDFRLSISEAIDLIKEYRILTPIQRRAVVETLKSKMKPENYNSPKTEQRDFHNWRNEAQQVFTLLNQTVYFECRQEKLVLMTGKDSFDVEPKRLKRSLSQKHEYFGRHKVNKTIGFELHHVMPLAWSESWEHFKLLDKWKNMVYIDAFSHAKITQNRNMNVIMESDNDNIKLSDYSNNEVYLELKKNILYKTSLQVTMKEYNNKLRETKRILSP